MEEFFAILIKNTFIIGLFFGAYSFITSLMDDRQSYNDASPETLAKFVIIIILVISIAEFAWS